MMGITIRDFSHYDLVVYLSASPWLRSLPFCDDQVMSHYGNDFWFLLIFGMSGPVEGWFVVWPYYRYFYCIAV